MKNKQIASIAALIATSITAAQAQTIAGWNFESDSIAINNNPAADTGSGTASSIGMNIYGTPAEMEKATSVRFGAFVLRLEPMALPTVGRAWLPSEPRERFFLQAPWDIPV